MSNYAYRNLRKPKNVISGVADFILIAPVYDFEVDGIKCPVAPFTDPGDEVTIKEDHVFKAGRGFAYFALAPEKNQLTGKTIGDKGFNKLDIEDDIFIPGSYVEVHEAVKNFLNTPCIALHKDADCAADMYYQLGCDCVFAYLTVDFSTGTTKDGNKGYAGKISYQQGYIQVYKGAVSILADSSESDS